MPTPTPISASIRSNQRSSRWRQPLIAVSKSGAPSMTAYIPNASTTVASDQAGLVKTSMPRTTAKAAQEQDPPASDEKPCGTQRRGFC
jgi:hypothetical protein